ncbi:MarR family winged helix-turn-helix transcriptional regulator [Actinomadura sp. KC345]|uniref:MarR family winged helix-turn-helix transcriptional regulator n=1 Tax=Actinomadura sp. KC345 TaxID=2530371 RepID=UPI001404A210|nr:MarR family winged helix-turn-helix transcriptional regulator [Actinomadura sp. KC345]
MRSPDGDIVADVHTLGRLYRYLLEGLRFSGDDTTYSVTGSRVFHELGRQEITEVAALRHRTGMDPGHLSRVLARLEEGGLVTRDRSPQDRRHQTVRLTARGRAASEAIGTRAGEAMRDRLTALPGADRQRLIDVLTSILDALHATQDGSHIP